MDQKIVDFHDYVVGDVLVDIPHITTKKMFGGYAIYQEGFIFALILSEGDLYFKVDDSNIRDYEQAGSEQFIYTGHKNKKPTRMSYWRLPDEILEDRHSIVEWVKKSVEVSIRKGKKGLSLERGKKENTPTEEEVNSSE